MNMNDEQIHRKRGPLHPPRPFYRFLRGYAFDPTLSIDIDTASINEVHFPVRWEELKPGPVGEYLEVIDYDPASARLYPPVNLDDPYVLATDGLTPSESNPRFHQQMVYAVAMTTIHNFERALGRKVLWAPQIEPDGREPKKSYVQRLRIYPHALRQANAYYSPQKKALLFGYFPASPVDPGAHLPGGTVFTCLSHDIVAHETTHALLDGMHRRFIEPTNPDVRAFHEAFADIVALFQHFTFPEVLRHQLAVTRGDLSTENLLGQIATQFGATTGRYGALRDAIGKVNPGSGLWEAHKPDPQALAIELEPHERGAILVAAVFDAFLTIYKSRVADLLRIATGGAGILPAGDLHPDLVQRLADEAAKAAGHVLQVCIRALDYMPLVDLTFGEYLRAIITADSDVVPFDDRGYRVAFIEAFRRRGIYPRDVRSLAVESLRWRTVDEPKNVRAKFTRIGRRLLQGFLQTSEPGNEAREFGWDEPRAAWHRDNRKMIFVETKRLRRALHDLIKALFTTRQDGVDLYEITGLLLTADHPCFDGDAGLQLKRGLRLDGDQKNGQRVAMSDEQVRAACPRFDVHILRQAQRVTPGDDLLRQYIIGIIQTRRDGFRGACTLILDAVTFDLQYAIKKPLIRLEMPGQTRLTQDQQRSERVEQYGLYLNGSSTYTTYFGEIDAREPFALLHSKE